MSVGIASEPLFPEFRPQRLTVEQYHRMGEAGVLDEEDGVELLEGLITPKMIHNPPHDAAVAMLEEAIRPLLPTGWSLRIQSAITTDDSEPEPDLVIVRGRARDYARRHPGPSDAALVVEVADASLQRDRRKCRVYARGGAPVYWIVNLVQQQIEVYESPQSQDAEPGYRSSSVYRLDDKVPVTIEGRLCGEVLVHDVLP